MYFKCSDVIRHKNAKYIVAFINEDKLTCYSLSRNQYFTFPMSECSIVLDMEEIFKGGAKHANWTEKRNRRTNQIQARANAT